MVHARVKCSLPVVLEPASTVLVIQASQRSAHLRGLLTWHISASTGVLCPRSASYPSCICVIAKTGNQGLTLVSAPVPCPCLCLQLVQSAVFQMVLAPKASLTKPVLLIMGNRRAAWEARLTLAPTRCEFNLKHCLINLSS